LAFFFVARGASINLLSTHVAFLPQFPKRACSREMDERRLTIAGAPCGDRRDKQHRKIAGGLAAAGADE
jgi:hypothetical protein